MFKKEGTFREAESISVKIFVVVAAALSSFYVVDAAD